MSKIVDSVQMVLDEIIKEYPGQFPDGPHFLNEIQTELKYYMEDGEIDSWTMNPLASEGWKLVLYKNNEEHIVLRNPDGGMLDN
jgi:hypothetical protein